MYKFLLSAILLITSLTAADKKYEFSFLSSYTQTQSIDIKEQVSFGVSIAKNFDYKYLNQIELGLLQSRQASYENTNNKTKIQRTFLNGIVDLTQNHDSTFYALLGLGNESIDKEFNKYKSGTFANLGIGYRYALNEYGVFKVDLRHALKLSGEGDNISLVIGFAIPFGEKTSQAPRSRIMKVYEEEKKVEEIVVKEQVVEEIEEEIITNNDIDNDGIDNEYDRCNNTPSGAKVDLNGCIISVNLSIQFKTGSDKINLKYSNKLEEFANFLEDNPTYDVVIEAHSDSVGKESSNLRLSQKRAESTIKELVKLGISDIRLIAKGYGEAKPIASNKTIEGRALNRRVTAIITK